MISPQFLYKNYRRVQKLPNARKVLISTHFLAFETQPQIWAVTKPPPLTEISSRDLAHPGLKVGEMAQLPRQDSNLLLSIQRPRILINSPYSLHIPSHLHSKFLLWGTSHIAHQLCETL